MKNKLIYNLLALAIAVLPALAVYSVIPGFSLGMLILLLISVGIWFIDVRESISGPEFDLFVAVLGISFVSYSYHTFFHFAPWFDGTLFIHNLFSIIVCFFPLITSVRHANVKVFLYALYAIGLLAAVVVIWQRLTLIVTGDFYRELFLPWFEAYRDVETMSIRRPSAFFSEPAHLCIFLLPIFYISLLSKRYLYMGTFLFAILCSGSTTGLIISVVLVVYEIFHEIGRQGFGRIVVVSALFVAVYYIIITFYPEVIYENMDKLEGVRNGDSDQRLLGPIEFLSLFDTFEWLFGITLNQLTDLIRFRLYQTFDYNVNFANAMLYMLISYGFVGCGCLIRYVYKRWTAAKQTKGFILVLIGVLCSDQVLFNANLVYLVTMVMLGDHIVLYLQSRNTKDI